MESETPALPDQELARRVRVNGDKDCFAELFNRYRKKVFCACHGFFSDDQRAGDATQETFLRAYRSIHTFREGEFSRWLMRIAKNVCIDEWRRNRHEIAIDALESARELTTDPRGVAFEIRVMAQRVWKELKRLPPDQRRCLELKIDGFSYEETAARTGLPLHAVKSHLQNGRRMLWQRITGGAPLYAKSKATDA